MLLSFCEARKQCFFLCGGRYMIVRKCVCESYHRTVCGHVC